MTKYNIKEIINKNITDTELKEIINNKIYKIIELMEFGAGNEQ